MRIEHCLLCADLAARGDWLGDAAPSVDGLSDAERRELGERWLADALMEHASVASFARFALALLAFGAPADLVADAHRAALEEIEHARDAFALASAYCGAPCGLSVLAIPARMELPKSLAELARETFVDGCINETLAALEAAERLERATDPTVRRVLQRVVEEETRHAELAWRTVAWALREGGSEVRSQIIASIRAPRALDDRARVAMREVIEPCAAALFLTV